MGGNSIHLVCPRCDTINRLPEARLGQHPKCGRCGASLFQGVPVELTGRNFQRHVGRNSIPVLVDFWAPWCQPCLMMAPAFKAAAKRLEPRLRLAKLNTQEEGETAGAFGIQSIPTLILFRDGKEVARQSGAMGAEQIVAWTLSLI